MDLLLGQSTTLFISVKVEKRLNVLTLTGSIKLLKKVAQERTLKAATLTSTDKSPKKLAVA